MSLTLNLLGILVALLCIFVAGVQWKLGYWKRRGFPYLEPTFIVGNLQNPFSKKKMALGPHFEDMYKEVKKRGLKLCGIYLSTRPGLMVTDLTYVKHILSTDFQHWTDRGLYYHEKADPMSAHLVSISGSKWKNLRRKMTPTFSSGKMKAMFPILMECSAYLEETLKETIARNEPADIKDILGNFTTDVIGSCAFGLECNSFKNDNSLFRIYGKKIFNQPISILIKRVLINGVPNLCQKLNMPIIDPEVRYFFTNVVKDTINYRKKNNVVKKDFLQLMMDMMDENDEYKGDGNTLTFNEINAQCFVFFAAGFETSATTMTFALFELAQHQDVQDKLRKEVNEVLEKHNNEFTYEAMNDLTYMSQVINESLRIYPPIPLVPRVCTEEYKFPGTDLVIEKGTKVILCISGIHHDEEYHEDPFKFDPDRFSEENKHKMNPYSHIPFGEGARICIGLRFGLMQAKVGLAMLLKKFKFTLNEKTKLPLKMSTNSFVSAPQDDIFLNCKLVE